MGVFNQYQEPKCIQQITAMATIATCMEVYRKQTENKLYGSVMNALWAYITLAGPGSRKGGMGDAGGGNAPGSGRAGRTGGTDDSDDSKTERTYTGGTDDSDIQSADESDVYGGGASQASDEIENLDDLQSHGNNSTKKGNASPNVDGGPVNNDRGA